MLQQKVEAALNKLAGDVPGEVCRVGRKISRTPFAQLRLSKVRLGWGEPRRNEEVGHSFSEAIACLPGMLRMVV